MHVIGLDIGGANLKAASTENHSVSIPFPIWKEPGKLENRLRELLFDFKKPDCYAVTMTAELADCFQTKSEGVNFILDSIEKMAGKIPVQVWQTGAEFVSANVAREIPLLVAASNWHALSTWVGRLATDGNALMIDIGSTTTDLILLNNGVPVPTGMTDPERLSTGELVYTGVKRTPLCALSSSLPIGENIYRLSAELFATTYDVYLLLKQIGEDANCFETANGKPANVENAYGRLARMLCADRTEFTFDQIKEAAEYFYQCQKKQIIEAIDQILKEQSINQIQSVIGSGEGEFLVDEIVSSHPLLKEASYTKLSKIITGEASQAACAYAVSRLAAERVLV